MAEPGFKSRQCGPGPVPVIAAQCRAQAKLGAYAGTARLPCQSQIKQELSPFYFSNSLSKGWTLPLSLPCLGQHRVLQDFLPSGRSKQAGATPKHVGPPCLAGLSPKTVSYELQAEEREKEKEEEGEKQIIDVRVVTDTQDRNTKPCQVR